MSFVGTTRGEGAFALRVPTHMSSKDHSHDERPGAERRKTLTHDELRELEMAGGIEGGMKAGSAGGPGEKDADRDTRSNDEDSDPSQSG